MSSHPRKDRRRREARPEGVGKAAGSEVRGAAARVELVVLDVDGVLTDGGILLDAAGRETKRFHVADGVGIGLLRRHGFEVGVVSARRSAVVEQRARELDLSFCLDGVREKRAALEEILAARGHRPEQLCFVGDDLFDLPCLLLSGFPVAVANAVPEVKRVAAYITRLPAAEGAVREVAEVLLRARKRWDEALARYSR